MLFDLDALLLSRIQFAFTVSFHIVFPAMTIGLAAFLVVLEGAWLRTGEAIYFTLYKFWSKLFALAFGMGVVTGLVLSYEFGTNWSRFAAAAGNVIGPLIGYEVLTAFFLEAGFIGIMLFGMDRVRRRLHFLATCMVALGSLFSAFWILAANSWMHTPAGYGSIGRRVSFVDWWQVDLQPFLPLPFRAHGRRRPISRDVCRGRGQRVLSLARRHREFARTACRSRCGCCACWCRRRSSIGDMHGLNTLEHQPVKVAAMEATGRPRRGSRSCCSPARQARERNDYEIAIPKLGSLILTHEWEGEVAGAQVGAAAGSPAGG